MCVCVREVTLAEVRGKLGSPEERQRLPLENVTRGLLKTQLNEKNAVANCRVYQIAIALEVILITSCSCPGSLFTNPNPLSSHIRDSIISKALLIVCETYQE
jgi:hypothetical protein